MLACAFCGGPFEWQRRPGQAGRAKIYCSQACGARARRKPEPRTPRGPATADERARLAEIATLKWQSISPDDRSAAMSRAAKARYSDEQMARAEQRRIDLAIARQTPCPYCGEPVGRAGRVKCAKAECHLAHNAARMKVHKQNYKARRRAAFVEQVDPETVYERDQWLCGICSERVDSAVRWPDLMCASLDHIKPLSLGGEHSYANVRLAHHLCNSRRGNRVAA